MHILVLFISSGIALFLLIMHSYFLREKRITLNFFIFAFILAFLKEGSIRKEAIYEAYPYLKLYGFSNDVPVFVASLIATIGWVFTFYISWCIAEKILRRIDCFKNKIFATLLMSSFVVIGVSYCIEVTAMNIQWWHWDIHPLAQKNLFVGSYSFLPIGAWLFFSLSFLIAFFLIECSKYRNSRWKAIFLFIPFIYGWSVYYYGPRVPLLPIGTMNVVGLFMFTILFLSLLNQLSFEHGYIDYNHKVLKNTPILYFLNKAPVFVLLLMLSIVIIVDLFVISKPILLISIIPLLFLLFLSIKKIPLQLIVIIALAVIISDKLRLRAIFTIVPMIFFLILWMFSKIKERIYSLEK
ncbi:MAG: hypothetical protein Q7O04_01590 [Candidatus Omnitrophota bacterium]|nr:hypothetical protein [Candidatus Omnitrophota bacterium]